MSYEFRDDIKVHYPMFVDSFKVNNPKVDFYFGPYNKNIPTYSTTQKKNI